MGSGGSVAARGGRVEVYYGGRIFRVVGKVGAFTTQEMERLEGYAAHLLGVASSLAAGHIYRTSPALQTLVAY